MKYLCGTTRVNDLCCVVVVITVLIFRLEDGQVNIELSQDALQIESPVSWLADYTLQVKLNSCTHNSIHLPAAKRTGQPKAAWIFSPWNFISCRA